MSFPTETTSQIQQSITSTQRPWREFLDISAISLPLSFTELTHRLKQNLFYFRINYTFITLLILFFSLIYHPISLITFLLTFVAWLYLYLFRTEPLEILNREIDDRVVLGFLSLVTFVALIWSGVWWNVVAAVGIGGVVVCLHAGIRAAEEGADGENPYGALLSVVDSPRGGYNSV